MMLRFQQKSNSDKNVYISLLLEHKQHPDKKVIVQLLSYLAEGYVAQVKEKRALELIIPVLFYHGKENWKVKSLVDLIDELPTELSHYVPSFKLNMLDVGRMGNQVIMNFANEFLKSALLLQKYSHSTKEILILINAILGALDPKRERNFIDRIFVYFIQNRSNYPY